ncbi:MAG: hypothetical protein AAF202_05185 [Pseudomonadota bacterium]
MILKSLILFTFALGASQSANAENKNVRVLRAGEVNGYRYLLTAEEHSHVLGQKFQVQLRYSCSTQASDQPENLPVQDSFSVCDLSPSSVKVNKSKTAIGIKTKAADREHYYEQVSQGITSPKLYCKSETEVRKFSLKRICRTSASE